MTRVYAIRGQKDRATQTMNEVIQLAGPEDRALAKKILESLVCQANGDTKGYLKAVEDAPTFEAAFLQRQFDKAAEMVGEQNNATAQLGLLYLQAARSAEVGPNLPEKRQASLLEALAKGNRDEKLVGDFLTGKKPLNVREAQRLAIAPDNKRILLLVLAQRFPDQAKQLVPLATRLNYQHDAISLCLSKLPEAKK